MLEGVRDRQRLRGLPLHSLPSHSSRARPRLRQLRAPSSPVAWRRHHRQRCRQPLLQEAAPQPPRKHAVHTTHRHPLQQQRRLAQPAHRKCGGAHGALLPAAQSFGQLVPLQGLMRQLLLHQTRGQVLARRTSPTACRSGGKGAEAGHRKLRGCPWAAPALGPALAPRAGSKSPDGVSPGLRRLGGKPQHRCGQSEWCARIQGVGGRQALLATGAHAPEADHLLVEQTSFSFQPELGCRWATRSFFKVCATCSS